MIRETRELERLATEASRSGASWASFYVEHAPSDPRGRATQSLPVSRVDETPLSGALRSRATGDAPWLTDEANEVAA